MSQNAAQQLFANGWTNWAREDWGQQKAARLFRERVGRHGPLECASPAIVDGKLIVRLKNTIACYNLAAGGS